MIYDEERIPDDSTSILSSFIIQNRSVHNENLCKKH